MKRQMSVVICIVLLCLGGIVAQETGDGVVQIIFMHHSTGAGVMNDGGVREAFTELGYAFWDHDYNEYGLSDASGERVGYSWNVPDDNTNPDGWYAIFNQTVTSPPSNTLSHMLEFDVIIFKSCFPASAIYDDSMLETYKRYYLSIREVIDRYPEKIFILWTTPPLVPNETTADQAARARHWAEYLTSDEYLAEHPNIFVFDFFTLMADEAGFLREEFRSGEWDSHPNWVGNRIAGPLLVQFVDEAVQNFVPGEPSEQPVIVLPEIDVEALESDYDAGSGDDGVPVDMETPVVLEPGAMIDDFEGGKPRVMDYWGPYADEGVEFSEFTVDGGHDGDALNVAFTTKAERYGGFGVGFYPRQDWSAASGLRFMWRSANPGTEVSLFLFSNDPAYADTPHVLFQFLLETPGDVWTEVVIHWDDLIKPDWVIETTLSEFNPAYVTGLSFGIGHWEVAQQDTLWIDTLQLLESDE